MTSAQRRPLRDAALIDAGLNIHGDLQTDGEVEVDRKIIGEIGCTHLTIGRDATITGNIKADEVLVRGKVRGTIRATRVILQDSANVEGDIYHDRIVIEDGARFIGASNAKTEMTELVGKLQDVAAEELHDVAAGILPPKQANTTKSARQWSRRHMAKDFSCLTGKACTSIPSSEHDRRSARTAPDAAQAAARPEALTRP
jgi:cytoskeletal protein CcmA (bactofilin family)